MAAGAQPVDSAVVVIFGASGDLTRRKLVPALHSLNCEGLLPRNTQVLGVARSAIDEDAWRDQLFEGVAEYARLEPGICDLWCHFAERVSYMAGAYDDPATYQRLAERLARLDSEHNIAGNRLFYLAVPPEVYPLILQHLGQAGLNQNASGWVRVIIEKPFGHDLHSAHELNDQAHSVFREEQIYRIDHYLGKETVQNLLVLRFANSIFEPLWNRNYVDHVQITLAEDDGVGHRAGYYDQAGVLRDMLQSHLLQLLALMAMEPPSALTAKALRDEKVKVLQAIRPIRREDGVWGQYEGYLQEKGVAPDSHTPTYFALKLYVDNWRWQGVPFYVRSGKRLATKTTEIVLQFKQVPHLLFPENAELAPNCLFIHIQPNEGLQLRFEAKLPGAGMRVEPVAMQFDFGRQFGARKLPEAYERLLLDAMQGDAALFARSDEIELAWACVDPLTQDAIPVSYSPGSRGPQEADALLARDGRRWWWASQA